MASPSRAQEYAVRTGDADFVPRQLLDDAMAGVERLKQKLDEANEQNRQEMETALKSMQWQLRTLQGKCKTAEDELKRSMVRERELRAQLADSEVSSIISNLREENDELRGDHDYLREQVAILTQDARLHASVKSELEGLQRHVRAAGLDHSHALATLMKEKEQLASEATEALSALRSELEARTQAHEEEEALAAERARELEGRVAELEANLAKARSLIVNAEEAAKAYSKHNTLLENDNATSERRIAEQEADIYGLQARTAELLQDLQASEKKSRAGLDQNALLAADNAQKAERIKSLEESVKSLEESLRAAEENGRHEREILSMQVQDQKRKIAALASEVHRAEDDSKTVRDDLRLELKKAESENSMLRDNLRSEREKMEALRQEHRRELDDLHQRLRGEESTLARRQEELQRRTQTLEKELQDIKASTVPESELVHVQEEALRAKQELLDKLQQSQEERQNLKDASFSQVERAEAIVRDLQSVMSDKDSRIATLSKQVKAAEEQVLLEQKQRQNAQEQVRLLSGDFKSNLKAEGGQPTKMAMAVVEILERGLESCRENIERDYARQRDSARVDGLLLAPQRTALGIALNGTRVDLTVPGSPAQLCGMIDKSDELLMVDGQKVSAQTAMAALRGSDVPASVVSLVLRKFGRGEVIKVQLPRTSLDIVKRRHELNENLEQLQKTVLQAFAQGAESQVADALTKIAKDARALDLLNFDLHLHLSNQVSALLEGVETLVSRSKASVLAMDATHQQVHVLQSLTESELRQQRLQDPAASGNLDREAMLQKQVQELEGDLKALQEELSAAEILRRGCLDDVHQLKLSVAELEDERKERQSSQDRLTGALSRIEDELAEAQGEISQQPYAVRVVLGVDYEETVANAEMKALMDLQLQEDISIALRIAKSQVEILCYSRGLGTMAELRISPTMSTPSHTRTSETATSGRALAEELQRQAADPKCQIHNGAAGQHIKEVEVHGPIAVQAARALRSALLEMEGDLTRARLEVARVNNKMTEASARHRAVIKEEELMKQEILKDCDNRLQAASTDFREQLARAVELEREQIQNDHELASKKQKAEHAEAIERQRLESQKKIISLESKTKELELELKAERDTQYGIQMTTSSAMLELERTKEKLRHAERTTSQIQQACRKVDEILVPELNSSLMTISNIENEMGFFHSHVMRAAAFASSNNGTSRLLSQDTLRSKECIEKDLGVLRLQLEILSQFSYTNPEELLQELSAAVAFAEASAPRQNGSRSSPDVSQREHTDFHSSPVMVSGHSYGSGHSNGTSDRIGLLQYSSDSD